jgi:hypothetical protein
MSKSDKLTFKYFHRVPDKAHGNLMWYDLFPMRGGTFPKDHPIEGARMIVISDDYVEDGSKFFKLRQRGYYVSCFPEGDGMVIDGLVDQSPEQVVKDIEEILEIKIERDSVEPIEQ